MIFFTTIILASLVLVVTASQNNLVSVVQIFRHGHRTPIKFYKNDRYVDRKYWQGLDFGQLTNTGKRQLYTLLQLTGLRYSSFLPRRYDKDNFFARSTDMDRTLMSGQSFLYGLFPAYFDQSWRFNTDWQPIPLHPADPKIIIGLPISCPFYDNYYSNAFSTEKFKKIDLENKNLFEYLSKHSGDNITTALDVWLLYDCIKAEIVGGLKVPDWVSPVYKQLRNLTGILMKTISDTTQTKRIFVGPFLKLVVDHLETMAANSSNSQKYQVFSAHDTNIATVLNSFGAFDPPYPPEFASTIWIELRESDGTHLVNVWSKDGNTLNQIQVNGCALDCPLPEFKHRLSAILLSTDLLAQECNANLLNSRRVREVNKNTFKELSRMFYNNKS